jgi:DNA-binding NarL/FixJ family response regulator
MRHPQVLVWEGDGRLAALLRPLAEERRWVLREPRQAGAVLRLLRRGGPAVVVIKTGRDLERELSLLERIAWLHPDAATVLVTDSDHTRLAGLAWDLGASHVLTPGQPRERLAEIVTAFLAAKGAP